MATVVSDAVFRLASWSFLRDKAQTQTIQRGSARPQEDASASVWKWGSIVLHDLPAKGGLLSELLSGRHRSLLPHPGRVCVPRRKSGESGPASGVTTAVEQASCPTVFLNKYSEARTPRRSRRDARSPFKAHADHAGLSLRSDSLKDRERHAWLRSLRPQDRRSGTVGRWGHIFVLRIPASY
jgi:hypothetical protein